MIQKTWLAVAGGVVLAFLIGFGWQYFRAEGLADRLADEHAALEMQTLEATLAAATVAAQRAQHETARSLMSDFYGGLQQHMELVPAKARAEAETILRQRDAVITALSRAEPSAQELLTGLYIRFRVALGGPGKALPVGTTAETDTAGS